MADKIKLSNRSYLEEEYEATESEDDFNEDERELFEKARNKRKRDDGEHEVLGFDEEDSEEEDAAEFIGASDIEDGDEYDGLPDEKAWGRKKSAFYNTDFVDQDYSTYNEQEEEEALQEEEEAKAIQQRLAKQLDEADFSLDVYSELPTEQDTKEEKIKLKTDITQLSSRQKLQLFQKDSPEFNGLVQDFERHITESENVLMPILEYAKDNNIQDPLIDFVQTKNNLTLTYCTNVGFYLILKSTRTPVKNHPVVKRLVQLRQLLLQLEDRYQNEVKPKLEEILEAIEEGEEIELQDRSSVSEQKKKKKRLNALKLAAPENEENDSNVSEEDESEANGLDSSDDEEPVEEEEQDANEEDDRRGITYQIAKNKGLTPHRKKELRNPRVKHRNKYRKAIVRRKGAVRTVRKELKRYSGEMSGIKSSVKKGIKIKS